MSLVLRPFEAEDWLTYAGCVSERPLIAETDDFTLIVDDDHVEVHRHVGLSSSEHYNLMWLFPDVGPAMLFALSVRGVEPDAILKMKASEAGGRLLPP